MVILAARLVEPVVERVRMPTLLRLNGVRTVVVVAYDRAVRHLASWGGGGCVKVLAAADRRITNEHTRFVVVVIEDNDNHMKQP